VTLVTSSRDGLLLVPLVFLVNTAQAWIEEGYDSRVRFPAEDPEDRQQTRRFGPIWIWAIQLAGLLVVLHPFFGSIA
jgi:hypothetical protein